MKTYWNMQDLDFLLADQEFVALVYLDIFVSIILIHFKIRILENVLMMQFLGDISFDPGNKTRS
jgi:hypothetical protein